MDQAAAVARRLAIGLARFVVENPEKELEGEQLAAIVYRLRVVGKYTSEDVDIICDALRILISKLVKLPPITFAPEVWMPIMIALSEGGVEPAWKAMMDPIDVLSFATPYMLADHSTETSAPSSAKCSDQITSICLDYVLEFKFTRRLFMAIWETEFEETMRQMTSQQWDSIKINASPGAGKQARYFFDQRVFESFASMKDHETFAKELFYASLARILKRFQEDTSSFADKEDIAFYEMCFEVYDDVIDRVWPFLCKDQEVKKNTLNIFEHLLGISSPGVLTQKCAEKFTDTCQWLKISAADMCTTPIEPRLWEVMTSLSTRLLEIKKSIPYEIDFELPDNFEIGCEALPSSRNRKELFLRSMVDANRITILAIMQYFRTSKRREEVVRFLRDYLPEFIISSENQISQSMIYMYIECEKKKVITTEDQFAICEMFMKTPAIHKIMILLGTTKNAEACELIIKKLLEIMAHDIEKTTNKIDTYITYLHSRVEFWPTIAKHADKATIMLLGKRLAKLAVTSEYNDVSVFAADMWITVFKLPLASLSNCAFELNFIWKDMDLTREEWDRIGPFLAQANVLKRAEAEVVSLLTPKHMLCVDLPMEDLVYMVLEMREVRTEDGQQLHRTFYKGIPDFEEIMQNFLRQEQFVAICATFLEILADLMKKEYDEKHILFSLEYEHILGWLEDIDVLDTRIITNKLVELCHSIEAWDARMLLQLKVKESSSEDLLTFSRLWKTAVMAEMSEDDQKYVEDEMAVLLKAHYEQQDAETKAWRDARSNGEFPVRPKQEEWEEHLLTMHNRIAKHLASRKLDEFVAESPLYNWLLGISSGQVSYDKDSFIDAKKVLARLYPDLESRRDLLYHHGMGQILYGISHGHEKGVLSMRNFFMNTYSSLVQSDMKKWKIDDSIERIDWRMGGFCGWLEDPTQMGEDHGLHCSIIIRLGDAFWLMRNVQVEQTIDDPTGYEPPDLMPISKFVEVICSKCDSIANWMLPSSQPYYFSAHLLSFFELVFSFPDIIKKYQEPIEKCFSKLFSQLFLREYQNVMLRQKQFVIQCTDKYLSSSLNIYSDYTRISSTKNDVYQIQNILSMFSKFGSIRVQLDCLKQIADALKHLPVDILEHVDILNGSKKVETVQDKRIVCDVTLLSECLGYANRLYKKLCSNADAPTDEILKAFHLVEGDVQARFEETQNSYRAPNKPDKVDMNFCTFKSTGKVYSSQHWYNCYTCDMIDSTGVCSTCAVNCHRGHELAYSKKGWFFCDCGYKKCGAMRTILHYPNALNSLRGLYPDSNLQSIVPKAKEVFRYTFADLVISEAENIQLREALDEVRIAFEEQGPKLETVLVAIEEANRRALNVSGKRKMVLDSLKNLEDVQVVENSFMSSLDVGHFLPLRRTDMLMQERLATPKVRDLADVIKLDNGTELLVMIPECVQTCLQLHYMDTRTHLLHGMFSLRTETEPIPFNARRLHVSENRLVVCGLYEIFAMRFSPKGSVIDRAHIKLAENGSTSSTQNNPVVKAEFCQDTKQRKQLVAIATLQYIRIYDLTLSETNFVEEMVLPTGNVEDLVILNQENGEIRILVLSTLGILYEHVVTDCSADNNSIFLTDDVNKPGGDSNDAGVSLHYSHTFNLVFASFKNATYYATLPKLPRQPGEPLPTGRTAHYEWQMLIPQAAVHVWRETSGLISCLWKDQPKTITHIHPTAGMMLLHTSQMTRPIMTHFLLASSKKQTTYSICVYPDMPTCEIWETKWENVHDLWIDDVPSERYEVEMVGLRSLPVPLEEDDLVLMAEKCEALATIDWSCPEIEMFYTHNELNHRLSVSESMPLTLVQVTHFTLHARLTNSRQIVRMVRIEVEGANGPDAIKIGNNRYSTSSRIPKTFDFRFTKDQSNMFSRRTMDIEIIPRPNQNTVKIKSLKLYGCDKALMDEVQPIFERLPIMTLPNRLVYSILEFSTLLGSDNVWTEAVAKKHLSRKYNHQAVCGIATKALVKCHPDISAALFETIDRAYLQEWKGLREWTEESGFIEMRMNYVEQLLERLKATRTRWPLFRKALKKEFGSVTSFVELLRDEMQKMPLHRCHLMAQAIVKMVFGALSEEIESEQLSECFLDIFTNKKTFYWANNLRSAVQETISRVTHGVSEERMLLDSGDTDLAKMKSSGVCLFYGSPRILKKTPANERILRITGSADIQTTRDSFRWMQEFINKMLEKLKSDGAINSAPTAGQHISDTPSYNLSRVLASCMAPCDPSTIRANLSTLIKLINFEEDSVYALTEEAYSNYALLRTLELLLFLCLDKRSEEKEVEEKPFTELLNSVIQELDSVGIRDFCLKLLEKLILHWQERGPATFARAAAAETRRVWLPHVPLVSSSANPPNATVMSIIDWPTSADDAYVIACTDLVLLIPQHLQEVQKAKTQPRDDRWIQKLCQLISLSVGCSAHRQSKKLLLAMCHGDESKYRTMRDKYKMQDLLNQLVQKYMLVSREIGGHQQLTEIVDVLTSITKLALNRPDMWRDVCSTYTIWLLRLACYATDVVASQVVELLIVAVRDSSVGGQLSIQLADSIIEAKNGEFIEKIIKRFLIGKSDQLRWTMHGMLRSVIQLASRQNQCSIVKLLYTVVYPMATNLGLQGAQLVDLIATYAPRVFSSAELVAMTQSEIATVERIGKLLESSGFPGMYRLMTELGLGWKSIQFDRNPCLVCFTSKESHEQMKMSSIRADTRYSANTLIYKLLSNYEVSRVTIKLSDVKKSKIIKRCSLYYCPKSVESVELKLHPDLWKKCAQVTVGENDTSISLSLAVPVVTSSLIVEFDEVVDARGSNQLHCPRCSGPVRSHSGVCESCGENAFQCIKCRSINYVEKEPFICQSCGFCKYARIELLVLCRGLPGAQHITCDAERGQCVQEMTQLLTKMETTKTKLTGFKAMCESLYMKSRPLPTYKLHVENNNASQFFEKHGTMLGDLGSTSRNPKWISYPPEPCEMILMKEGPTFQGLTQPMNNIANLITVLHKELCHQTQQLMYLHEELNRYDHASEVSIVFHKTPNIGYYSTSDTCFGCLCNQILHSIALIHSASEDENALTTILSAETIIDRIGSLAQSYEPLREEIEELLVRLMFGRADVTAKVESLIQAGEVNVSVMVKSLLYAADPTWQQKLKLLIRVAIEKRDENSCLQALMVLNKYMKATKSVPADEKKKIRITSNSAIAKWLTSEEEWKDCCSMTSTSKASPPATPSNPYQWISDCLFSQWMSVRSAANQLLVSLSRQRFHEPLALLLLCENLSKISEVPTSACDQFMNAAHTIIGSSVNTKARLFVQQFHVYLIRRIHEECAALHSQSISMNADITFGERLRCFVEILTLLLSGSNVENVLLKAGADDLLIFLLHSTIFLKRIMTRRNRAIDSSRMALEKLLRRVSCRDGTKLMGVCVESLKLVKDTSTLGIVVGVMMEIMNPQQETEETFLIQIEKDVAQEDFLQGRMTHNPYNSSDPGMGPLMRDIKNKICRDTEMIALMEDDNGMELLVNSNIISLSLPVREVYDRLWKRNNGGSPMLIVYRMRGLMGDAVETFIESFGVAEGASAEDEEDEQLVRMCQSLMRCGGLDKLMDLLATSIESSSGRFLLSHLRKIFDRIVKTSAGRRALVERRLVERLMSVVRTCCADPTNESKVMIGMELYKVIEFVVLDKNVHNSLCGIAEADATWWFELFEKRGREEGSITELHRRTSQILEQMTVNIGNIVLGSDASEKVLIDLYPKVLKWSTIDAEQWSAETRAGRHRVSLKDQTILMTEQLAVITSNILQSPKGIELKQKILDSGVIASTCQYLTKDVPNLFQPTESDEWKKFLARPSLKLILTLLAGLARGHQAAQKEIAKTTLKLMHRLEQVASDNSIGTLAENVIDALNEDEEVKNLITQVREETKKKKKQLAMVNRQKQLNKLGMKVGSSGEVKVSARNLHNEPTLDDTDALSCCICRESVLRGERSAGVYAFAANDPDSGKTGSVSMMVMVHFDCHKNAIRGSGGGRATDEWTRAKLHNAGAKCNVITPIAAGICSADAWREAIHRFETDVGRISGLAHGLVNRNSVFLDICKLIDRFIYKRSFSNQSDGGGRESNMQYLSILHLLGVSLPATDVELETASPNHRLVAFLFTELTLAGWNDQKNDVLRASLNDAQTNGVAATWEGFRPTLLTWAFVDAYFNKVIPISGEDRLEWLREHLRDTINKTRSFVEEFDSNVLPCEEPNEFCEVTGAPIDDVTLFLVPQ